MWLVRISTCKHCFIREYLFKGVVGGAGRGLGRGEGGGGRLLILAGLQGWG